MFGGDGGNAPWPNDLSGARGVPLALCDVYGDASQSCSHRHATRSCEDMRVMAVDPGVVTGLAWATVDLDDGRRIDELVRESWERGGKDGGCWQLDVGYGDHAESRGVWRIIDRWLCVLEPDLMVWEDFRLFPNERHAPDQRGTVPMRMLAAMDMMWWLAKNVPVEDGPVISRYVKQMPGERSVVKVEQLKRWGLWRTPKQHGGKDAMAATQHLIVALRKERG